MYMHYNIKHIFPKVVGCVDGTKSRFPRTPTANESDFVNRKKIP